MKARNQNGHFSSVVEHFLTDFEQLSDNEVLSEAVEDFGDVEAVLGDLRAEVRSVIESVAKKKLLEARSAAANYKDCPAENRENSEKAKTLFFDVFLSSHSEVAYYSRSLTSRLQPLRESLNPTEGRQMANQPTLMSLDGDESEDLKAARQELDVLNNLSPGVSAQIAELSERPQSLGQIDNTEFALLEHRYARLKAFEELAHSCYGRTVIGKELDEEDRPKRAFTYRITQANVGFADKNCFVVARNSPLATALVTAQPGEEREVTTRGGERYLKVAEVRTFEGPISLRSPNEKPNFRSMAIRRAGYKRPIVVEDLRSTVLRSAAPQIEEVKREVPERLDVTWLADWTGIFLSATDEQSLGHHFFTRTTEQQERALNNPRGLTLVEGIAGAGKTSVALGRLKFFANFATGAEREYYGLQNAPENDFSPVGMMGFVLSHSLKRYLKETASALELEHLPIRDFEEFRADLSDRFGIAQRFRKKKAGGSPLRSRIRWLRALDTAMANAAGEKLRKNLAQAGNASEKVLKEVALIADDLLRAELQSDFSAFHLEGLASRVVGAIAEAELLEQEADARERFRVREKADNSRRRLEENNLEREMRRIQQQAERKTVSPLARSVLLGVTAHDLFLPAIVSEKFPVLVQRSFDDVAQLKAGQGLTDAIREIRNLLSDGQGRPAVAESDLVTLVICAAMIADGFDYTDQTAGLSHLYQMRRNTAVFIDEVQDFAEIEIVLMGMSATKAYHQITLSGDRCQQLQAAGPQAFDDLFPWVPRSQRNRTILLDQNFRQREELASLSAAFRFLILGDNRIDRSTQDKFDPAAVFTYVERNHFADFVLDRIRSLPHHATVAVITPTAAEAQTWFDLLDEDLSSYHRAAMMSRRDDLTKRVNIHFTEVRETKGLEFDVVIIPDFGSFGLDGPIGRNQAYVAISRAKHALVVGCAANHVDRPEIAVLDRHRLVTIRDVLQY